MAYTRGDSRLQPLSTVHLMYQVLPDKWDSMQLIKYPGDRSISLHMQPGICEIAWGESQSSGG
jgi:hypothetical protein